MKFCRRRYNEFKPTSLYMFGNFWHLKILGILNRIFTKPSCNTICFFTLIIKIINEIFLNSEETINRIIQQWNSFHLLTGHWVHRLVNRKVMRGCVRTRLRKMSQIYIHYGGGSSYFPVATFRIWRHVFSYQMS